MVIATFVTARIGASNCASLYTEESSTERRGGVWLKLWAAQLTLSRFRFEELEHHPFSFTITLELLYSHSLSISIRVSLSARYSSFSFLLEHY